MRWTYSLVLLALSVSLLGCDMAPSEPPTSPWSVSGLEGRDVQELSLRLDVLYAATDSGLYRRPLNSNASWAAAGLAGKHVVDLTWRKDGTMLAGVENDTTENAVLFIQSTPSSTEWIPFDDGYGPERNGVVRALAAVPSARDTLYARGMRNVARSVDGGEEWTSVWGTWDDIGYQAPLLHVSAHNPGVVFAGGEHSAFQPYLVRSADYGATWQSFTGPLSEGDNAVYSILEHPDDPNRLLLGLEGRVMRTEDGGVTWTVQYEPPDYTYIFDFAVRREENQTTIFAAGSENGTQGGALTLHRSDNFGTSWERIVYAEGPDSTATRTMEFVERNGQDRLYLGTTKGIYTYRP